MKITVVLLIALGITFYSYAYTWGQGQSPAMGLNGLVFQFGFGLPFPYQTLTVEHIPLVQNDSTAILKTITIYTRYYQFNPIWFLCDWMAWTLGTFLFVYYGEKLYFRMSKASEELVPAIK
jgi:hypothetical protein